MARTSTRSRNFDRLLASVRERRQELEAVRGELTRRRAHFLPPSYFKEPANRERVAQAEAEQQAIEELEERAAELEREIDELWQEAGATQDAAGRLPGSDEEIEAEINALDLRRRQLQALRGSFVEDAHDNLSVALAAARDRLSALLGSPLHRPDLLQQAAAAWAFSDRKFEDALRARIDAGSFADGSRADWQAALDLLGRQVARRRAELDLRAEERAVEQAEQERKQAADRLAAVQA